MSIDDQWVTRCLPVPDIDPNGVFEKQNKEMEKVMQQMADRQALEDNANQASIDSLEVLKRLK